MSRKPIILLGMYQVNDIYKLLIQNLEKQGFQVVDISYNHIAPPFKYSSLKMRLGAFWCKKVLKQKKKKEILRKKARLRHFTKIYQEMMEKINIRVFRLRIVFKRTNLSEVSAGTGQAKNRKADGGLPMGRVGQISQNMGEH